MFDRILNNGVDKKLRSVFRTQSNIYNVAFFTEIVNDFYLLTIHFIKNEIFH